MGISPYVIQISGVECEAEKEHEQMSNREIQHMQGWHKKHYQQHLRPSISKIGVNLDQTKDPMTKIMLLSTS